MDKDNKKSVETKSYIINIIDSIRFISTSLTHHVNNLSEIHKEKFIDKNCKSECEFKGVKNKELFYDCKNCRKEQLKKINQLIEKFSNTYEFCNGDINKFVLMLRKVLIRMNIWTAGKDLMKYLYLIKNFLQ